MEWSILATPSGSEAALSPTEVEHISNVVFLCLIVCFRLVSAGGDIKITKDGQILLKEVVRSPFSSSLHHLMICCSFKPELYL